MSGFVSWMESWLEREPPRWSDLYLRINAKPVIKGDNMMLSRLDDAPPVMKEDIEFIAGQRIEWGTEVELDCGVTIASYRFRVNVYRAMNQGGAVLRRLESVPPSLDGLDLPVDVLRRKCAASHGLVIVAGETGSGKTTTLSALMYERAMGRSSTTITIEDPVEILFPKELDTVDGGVSQFIQREVGRDTASFSSGLRSALREAPDVITIGEIRDTDSASLALQAAETGHLVFATLHTRSAQETVSRLLAFFPQAQHTLIRQQLASGLVMVMRQVLIPSGDHAGRVLAYELMTNDAGVAASIRMGKDAQLLNEIRAGGVHGMVTLNDMLARLVREDRITEQEAMRHSYDVDELQNHL